MKTGWVGISLMLVLLTLGKSPAQRPTVDLYQVNVIMQDGQRYSGILYDVTETTLYIGYGSTAATLRPPFDDGLPLDGVKKVVVKRLSKRVPVITGAVVGGLFVAFLTHQSLQKSPPRSSTIYGLSLVLGTGVGAGVGAFAGSLIGNPTRRVIRPHDRIDPAQGLYRELRPFSYQYQVEVIDRITQ